MGNNTIITLAATTTAVALTGCASEDSNVIGDGSATSFSDTQTSEYNDKNLPEKTRLFGGYESLSGIGIPISGTAERFSIIEHGQDLAMFDQSQDFEAIKAMRESFKFQLEEEIDFIRTMADKHNIIPFWYDLDSVYRRAEHQLSAVLYPFGSSLNDESVVRYKEGDKRVFVDNPGNDDDHFYRQEINPFFLIALPLDRMLSLADDPVEFRPHLLRKLNNYGRDVELNTDFYNGLHDMVLRIGSEGDSSDSDSRVLVVGECAYVANPHNQMIVVVYSDMDSRLVDLNGDGVSSDDAARILDEEVDLSNPENLARVEDFFYKPLLDTARVIQEELREGP